jgi:hypothetical protein
MACDEKARLVKLYEFATTGFAEAVTELRRKMGTVPKSEYESLSRAADEARLKSETARLAVERHEAEHGC